MPNILIQSDCIFVFSLNDKITAKRQSVISVIFLVRITSGVLIKQVIVITGKSTMDELCSVSLQIYSYSSDRT